MADETAPKRHLTTMGLNDWVSAASAWGMRITTREPLSRVREPEQYGQWLHIVGNNIRADEIVVVFNNTIVELIAAVLHLPDVFLNPEDYCAVITNNSTHMAAKWVFDREPRKLAIQAWIGNATGECMICYEQTEDPAVCFQCGKGLCATCLKSVSESAVPKCPCCRVDWVHYE